MIPGITRQVRADNPELGFLDIGRKLGEMLLSSLELSDTQVYAPYVIHKSMSLQ
jgi:hypothetical protein